MSVPVRRRFSGLVTPVLVALITLAALLGQVLSDRSSAPEALAQFELPTASLVVDSVFDSPYIDTDVTVDAGATLTLTANGTGTVVMLYTQSPTCGATAVRQRQIVTVATPAEAIWSYRAYNETTDVRGNCYEIRISPSIPKVRIVVNEDYAHAYVNTAVTVTAGDLIQLSSYGSATVIELFLYSASCSGSPQARQGELFFEASGPDTIMSVRAVNDTTGDRTICYTIYVAPANSPTPTVTPTAPPTQTPIPTATSTPEPTATSAPTEAPAAPDDEARVVIADPRFPVTGSAAIEGATDYAIGEPPGNGTATVDASGTYIYQADNPYLAGDSFIVTATGPKGITTVTVAITFAIDPSVSTDGQVNPGQAGNGDGDGGTGGDPRSGGTSPQPTSTPGSKNVPREAR